MDLENFVASTLTQVANGVKKAQENSAASGAWINPAGLLAVTAESLAVEVDTNAQVYLERVQFDVAVTVSTDQAGGAEGKITVLGMRLGAGGQVNYENATVSRVQFSVPVAWPGQRNEELEKKREAARKAQNEKFAASQRSLR